MNEKLAKLIELYKKLPPSELEAAEPGECKYTKGAIFCPKINEWIAETHSDYGQQYAEFFAAVFNDFGDIINELETKS